MEGASADTSYVGGMGAEIGGEFNLTAGTTLQIVVGQQGVGQSSGSNGGGGGGSFVVDDSDSPMLVAGGGGGTRVGAAQNGCDASITEYGIIGSGSSNTSLAASYSPLSRPSPTRSANPRHLGASSGPRIEHAASHSQSSRVVMSVSVP